MSGARGTVRTDADAPIVATSPEEGNDMANVTVNVPTLRKGPNEDAPGMAVFRLQQILNTVGAGSLDEDGEFGSATEKAVKVVQKKLNLAVDGIVGKDTWTALLKTYFFGSLPG